MKPKPRVLLAISLAILLAAVDTPAQDSQPGAKGKTAEQPGHGEFESWVNSFLTEHTDSSQMPVLGLVVVKDGNVFFHRIYGQTSTKASSEQTIFRAASVSKLVTATAMMQLVEQGKLNLDADINTYLKRFQIENTYPSPITARHLLTHTSGIEDRLFGNTVRIAGKLFPLGDYFATHLPRRIRPPGMQIAYSNTGMALAGHLVEVISGLTFEDYVERHILQPLGMTHSSFQQPYPAHLAANVVPSGADSEGLLLLPRRIVN